MGVLDVNHPDIEEFIRLKAAPGRLKNFNLSVAVNDQFIECLDKGQDFPLIHSRTRGVTGKKSAEQILDLMAQCAWKSGDPGILFVDRINRANPTPGLGRIEATNPCGEQPLLSYEGCTLGSINLTKVMNSDGINYLKLEELVHLAVHFLDNVVEINRYPIRQVEEWSRMNRKIGIGVMGFADALILMGIPYQSRRAVRLASNIMSHIQVFAADASARLAKKRGNFPAFDHSVFPARGIRRRRNAALTTIAPTGTISLIAGTSSGIEPVFAFQLKRRVMDTIREEVHPIYQKYVSEGRKVPEDIFQTAWQVRPEWHLKIQEAFQEHTDSAVSKTVNFPADATVEDIRSLYLMAVHSKVKGVTVYRDQSQPVQILSAGDPGCAGCD